jgi:hypothetical protein
LGRAQIKSPYRLRIAVQAGAAAAEAARGEQVRVGNHITACKAG